MVYMEEVAAGLYGHSSDEYSSIPESEQSPNNTSHHFVFRYRLLPKEKERLRKKMREEADSFMELNELHLENRYETVHYFSKMLKYISEGVTGMERYKDYVRLIAKSVVTEIIDDELRSYKM